MSVKINRWGENCVGGKNSKISSRERGKGRAPELMAISSEQDSEWEKPTKKRWPRPRPPPPAPPSPESDLRVGLGLFEEFRYRPGRGDPQAPSPSPQHRRHQQSNPPVNLGRRPLPPPPAPAATVSAQIQLQGQAAAARGKKERPVASPRPTAPVDGHGPGVGLKSGRQRPRPQAPASWSCAAAVNQRTPLAGVGGTPNLFEEFRYIPRAERNAQDQAMAASKMMQQQQQQQEDANPNSPPPRAPPAASYLLKRCPAIRSTMAVRTSNEQQEGSSRCHSHTPFHCEAPVPSCTDTFCHGCARVRVTPQGQGAQGQPVSRHNIHPVGATAVNGQTKNNSSSRAPLPLSCADNKFCCIPLANRKDQEQDAPQLSRPSISLARFTPIGGPKVGRKRRQTDSQARQEKHCAAKTRKTAPLTAAEKPKNRRSVSRQKPKNIPAPVLSTAEKRLDMYRRLPPDRLVTPRRRTPYNLLQERYAPDPWKVIVICMLLNRTRGKSIKELVEGFFVRYPDAQTACNVDLEEMVEYLRPTGLQLEKSERIRKFSSSYLSPDWTYVTELHGVGKYAADAYAIFCAGRATEVQPEDHKLVEYWKYVCNIGEPYEDDESCFAI